MRRTRFLRTQLTVSYELRGIACMNLHIWNTLCGYCTRTDDSAGPHDNSGTNNCLRADPRAPFASDVSAYQAHVHGGPIVIACAKVCALRKAAVFLDLYVRQIVNPQIFTQPRMLANLEIPRKFHSQARLDVDALPYLCPKQAQQAATKPRGRDQMGSK
jgi:hypothetical protein